MNGLPRSWWGERFIAALERFTDGGRLGRGRAYLRSGKIQDLVIAAGRVSAAVEGGEGPYGEADKAPRYQTTLALTPLSAKSWRPLLGEIGSRAGMLTKLLLNELPDEVEQLAEERGLALLPAGPKDFTTACDCPDYLNPCKHVAGVCYRLAGMLDHDPLLLFELRGLSRAALRRSLLATPLGKALASTLDETDAEIVADAAYYPQPVLAATQTLGYHDYWQGEGVAPADDDTEFAAVVGTVLKRGGDQPPFWVSEKSFIEAMDEFYERVRRHHDDLL